MCPMVHARKTKILTHPGRTVERERSTRGHWVTAFFRQTHLCTKRGDATRRDRVCIRPRVQRGRARIEAYPLRRSPRGNWRFSVTHGCLVLPARFDQNGTFADFCLCQRCAGWPLCRPESQTQWWERRKESGRRRRTYIHPLAESRTPSGQSVLCCLFGCLVGSKVAWIGRMCRRWSRCLGGMHGMGLSDFVLVAPAWKLWDFVDCYPSNTMEDGLFMFDGVSENGVLFKILGARVLFGRKHFERIIKLPFVVFLL